MLRPEGERRPGILHAGVRVLGTTLLRIAAMVLLEQHEEWPVGRRYLTETSMPPILTRPSVPETTPVQLAA